MSDQKSRHFRGVRLIVIATSRRTSRVRHWFEHTGKWSLRSSPPAWRESHRYVRPFASLTPPFCHEAQASHKEVAMFRASLSVACFANSPPMSHAIERRMLGSSRIKRSVIAVMVSATVLLARRLTIVRWVLRSCSTRSRRSEQQRSNAGSLAYGASNVMRWLAARCANWKDAEKLPSLSQATTLLSRLCRWVMPLQSFLCWRGTAV